MPECPELSMLDGDAPSSVRDHVAACASCRIVVELLEERKRGVEARGRRDECARFEMLLAARDEGTLGGTAGALLEAHLRECADCQAVAATLPPPSERREHSALPPVSTAAYALGREVARGGMGRILAADDLRIGRPVAVKELLGKNPTLAARFEREARVTARLQHPGIVPIYEIGTWPDGTPFYAMRMVEGRTLREAIRDKQALDERLALLPAVIAAAEAVAFAHGKQIIHRDLTPNNILVGAHGDTVVIDWGLAKDLSAKTSADEEVAAGPYRDAPATDGNLTTVGAVIGTAAYMPPEQASGAAVDERADVYALGAILYHVLAGDPPYRASKSEDMVRQVQAGPPPALHEVAPGAPRDLASIVDKAMSRDPEARYATAAQLVEELRRFQTGRLVEAHHYSRGERVRRWIRVRRVAVFATAAALAAIAVAGSIGFAGVVRARDHAERERTTAVQQRAAADAAKAKADRTNTALMAEQGRQELLAGNTTRALAWLNEAYKAGDTSPELRYLLGVALRRVESIVHSFDCSVKAVRFSPDGVHGMGACAYGIGIVRLSDWAQVLIIPTKLDDAIYSPDGKLIASWNYSVLAVWDAATGAEQFVNRDFGARLRTVMFTPDGRTIITTSDDAAVRFWDVATGRVTRTLDARSGAMNVVRGEVTPDGRTLVTMTTDGVVQEWDVATGARRLTFRLPAQTVVGRNGAISPEGARLITCGADGAARVSELATGRLALTMTAHAHAAFDCSFSKDGRVILTTGLDGAAKIWDATTGQLVSTMTFGGLFADATLSPDGQRVATVGSDGGVRIWHAATGTLLGSIDDPAGLSKPLVFSDDGRTLVAARDQSSVVVMRDLGGDFEPVPLPSGQAALTASPHADRFALKGPDGAITLFDTRARLLIHHEALREPIAWSSDGLRVAGTAADGVVVIDARDGHTLARLATAKPEMLQLDDRGQRLLVAASASEVWDVDRGQRIVALGERSDGTALSGDGATVVGWHDARHAELWDVAGKRVRAPITLEQDINGTIGFADGGKIAILATREGPTGIGPIPFASKLVAYDAATGAHRYEFGRALLALIDPTGRHVIAAGTRKDVEIRSAIDGTLESHVQPGPAFVIVGQLVVGGQLLSAVNADAISLRSARDGRLLQEAHSELQFTFTQDSFEGGGPMEFADDGNTIVMLGQHPALWHLRLEERSPAEVDRIVRERVRWRVRDGGLVPLEATLRGRILRHGKPVAGAQVSVEHIGLTSWPHVTTDRDGRFELAGLPHGHVGVICMAPDESAKGMHDITLDRDEVTADFELDEEATISGQVVDERGQPVPNVEVRANATPTGDPGALHDTTDAGGHFTIRALGAQTLYVSVTERKDFKSTGVVHVGGPTVKVTMKTNTDAITGVQLVVRRVAP